MTIRISSNRINLEDATIQRPVLKDYGETLVTANSSTAYTIDLTSGNSFEITLTGNCTFTFSNPPASGTAGSFTLILKQDATGGRTVTWPGSVKWSGALAPTITSRADGLDIVTFLTTDAGTTWWGAIGGSNLNHSYKLFSWGLGTNARLGLGDTVDRSSPLQVGTLITWTQVSAYKHSLVLRVDGTLWGWGLNGNGQLGLGDTADRSSPVQIGTNNAWNLVCTGGAAGSVGFSAAIKAGGTLWTWGPNGTGQLGMGDAGVTRSSPVQVGTLTDWSTLACGNASVAAIKTDGTLWTWGNNSYGQLGGGNTASRSSPVQVGTLTNWSKISISSLSVQAIKTDGTLWTWGRNLYGHLGHGDVAHRSSPVQVGTLTTWSSLGGKQGTGSLTFGAIKTDGTLWLWGQGSSGELGQGDVVVRSSPTQVGTLTTWSRFVTAAAFTAAIKTDGTLWSWGSSANGKLGHGDTLNRSSPVQVGTLTTWSKIEAGYATLFGLRD